MAFWGAEIQSDKPYKLQCDAEKGRLHVSQATLGDGSSKGRTVVLCTVGDKKPIYLCSLLPTRMENCPLNVEIAEYDEVTLSVNGPHSVHLSGYFIHETRVDARDDKTPYDARDDSDDTDSTDADDDSESESGKSFEEITNDDKPDDETDLSKNNAASSVQPVLESDQEFIEKGESSGEVKRKKTMEGDSGDDTNSTAKRKKDDSVKDGSKETSQPLVNLSSPIHEEVSEEDGKKANQEE